MFKSIICSIFFVTGYVSAATTDHLSSAATINHLSNNIKALNKLLSDSTLNLTEEDLTKEAITTLSKDRYSTLKKITTIIEAIGPSRFFNGAKYYRFGWNSDRYNKIKAAVENLIAQNQSNEDKRKEDEEKHLAKGPKQKRQAAPTRAEHQAAPEAEGEAEVEGQAEGEGQAAPEAEGEGQAEGEAEVEGEAEAEGYGQEPNTAAAQQKQALNILNTFLMMAKPLTLSDFTPTGIRDLQEITKEADIPNKFWRKNFQRQFNNPDKGRYQEIVASFKKKYIERANAVFHFPFTLTKEGEEIYETCGQLLTDNPKSVTKKDIAYSLYIGNYQQFDDTKRLPDYPAKTVSDTAGFSGPLGSLVTTAQRYAYQDHAPRSGTLLIKILDGNDNSPDFTAPDDTTLRPAPEITEFSDATVTEHIALLNEFFPDSIEINKLLFTTQGIDFLGRKQIHYLQKKSDVSEVPFTPEERFESLVSVLLANTEYWLSEAEQPLSDYTKDTPKIKAALYSTTKDALEKFRTFAQTHWDDSSILEDMETTSKYSPEEKKVLAFFKKCDADHIIYSTHDRLYSLLMKKPIKAPLNFASTDFFQKITNTWNGQAASTEDSAEHYSYAKEKYIHYMLKKNPRAIPSEIQAKIQRIQLELREKTHTTSLLLPTDDKQKGVIITTLLINPQANADTLTKALADANIEKRLRTNLPNTEASPSPPLESEDHSPLNLKTMAGGGIVIGGLASLLYLLTNKVTRGYTTDYLKKFFSSKHRLEFATRTPLYRELAKNYGHKVALALAATAFGGGLFWFGLRKKS